MKWFAPLLLVVTGCYLSHELGGADASARDAGVDAHVGRCEAIAAGPTVLIDHDGVTPRLVALEGGEVGLAYVDPGSGDPTSVYYERLGADLARLTGPVLVTRTSWTWAEPARHGAGVVLAFGNAVDEGGGSTLLPLDADGVVTGAAVHVAAMHPDILRAFGSQLLWVAFESHDANVLALAHVGPDDGALPHGIARVPMGRYGSQHGAAELPGGGHLVAYASEGPPGVRRPRVSVYGLDGMVAGERMLADQDADATTPVVVGGDAYVVWRGSDAIAVTRLDAVTLETRDERRIPRMEGALFAADVEGHFVIVAAQPPALVALDLGTGGGGGTPLRIEVPFPRATWSGAASIAVVPGAVVVAAGLTDGAHALPWVVRLDCVER